METKGRKLTKKQNDFLLEYQRDWNAARAAREVGYSAKSAKRIGYRLVHQSPLFQTALKEDIDERLKRKGYRADATIEGLLRVAHLDLRKLFNPDGTMKKPDEWDDDTTGALAGLEVTELFVGKGEDRVMSGYLKKVKTNDRVEALVTLAKIQKLLGPDIQNTANIVIIEAGQVTKPYNSGMSQGGVGEIDGRE